jgi:hypothetical protein
MSKSKKPSALERLRPVLEALPRERVGPPPMPIDRLLAEARSLAESAAHDRDALCKVGLDPSLIADLRDRADALAEAQAELQATRRRCRGPVADRKLVTQAAAFRAEMLGAARSALRADPSARSLLDRIEPQRTPDGLRRALKEISLVYSIHATRLSRAGVSPIEMSTRAQELIDRIDSVYAARRVASRLAQTALRLRDLAAHHLTFALSEIRAAATYVFRHDPDHLARYRSTYFATKRSRRRASRPRDGGKETKRRDRHQVRA